jgi:hypothetical protein
MVSKTLTPIGIVIAMELPPLRNSQLAKTLITITER